MGNFLQKEMTKIFTIIPNAQIDVIIRAIQTFAKRDTYVQKNLEIYQSVRTFLIKKGIKIKKKFFKKYLEVLIEQGFTTKMYRNNFPNYLMKYEREGGEDGFVHFESVQQYIEANTKVSALQLDKLDYLFRIYFALVTAILFLALVQYCVLQLVIRLIQNWLLHLLNNVSLI